MSERLDPAYAADRTALLIVDPYNDFMSEGGKLYERTKETAEAVGFCDNMRKLIPAIRAARILVIIVPHHRWRAGDYAGWTHMNPSQVGANRAQGFAAGSWGGAFHPEFGPRDDDVLVLEHWAQSGFANTDLDVQLKQQGILLASGGSSATTSRSSRMRPPRSAARACMRRTRSMVAFGHRERYASTDSLDAIRGARWRMLGERHDSKGDTHGQAGGKDSPHYGGQ